MFEKLTGAVTSWLNSILVPDPSVEFMRLKYSSTVALNLYEQALTHWQGDVPFYYRGKMWRIRSVETCEDVVSVRGVEIPDPIY